MKHERCFRCSLMTAKAIQSKQVCLSNSLYSVIFCLIAETPSSDSVPVSGEGVPSLSQPSQTSEENSNSSTGAGVPPRGPEPPDLADKSSQSSLASFDDTGLTKQRPHSYILHSNTFDMVVLSSFKHITAIIYVTIITRVSLLMIIAHHVWFLCFC